MLLLLSQRSFFLQDVDEFQEELLNYVMQCPTGLNLFPIVKKVKVSVPSNKFPQNVVLVDVPGHHDCNRARKEIADKVQ